MTKRGVSAAAFGALDMLEDLKDRAADAHVPINSVTVLPEFNPRRLLGDHALSPEALAELAENIRTYGILQPILVRRRRAEILLVAGERRLRAAQLAGLTSVPVVYVEADDEKAYEIAIIENAQRDDLDLVTESLVGFKYLSTRLNLSVDDVVSYLHNVRKGRREDDLGVEQVQVHHQRHAADQERERDVHSQRHRAHQGEGKDCDCHGGGSFQRPDAAFSACAPSTRSSWWASRPTSWV